MAISEDGYFVCDYCGEDTGKFNSETGNHWICEKYKILIDAVKDYVQVSTFERDVYEDCFHCGSSNHRSDCDYYLKEQALLEIINRNKK